MLLLALINPVHATQQGLSVHIETREVKEMNKKQFIKFVIEPTLKKLGLYSESATNLLVMIAAHESMKGHYIVQTTGQAKGLFQMEDATHDYLLAWVKSNKPELYKLVVAMGDNEPSAMKMVTDLDYATAMARVFFLRFPEALPSGSDTDAMAAYAKLRWNTKLGKATPADYKNAYLSWK
ncbi:hypothetical protein [Sphingobacterium alkalisoli]|nr:hypothetical protein [Sphingobacterium alkalisoli]